MYAILQLVSAPLNPRPIIDYFGRSYPPSEYSYRTNTSTGKDNLTELKPLNEICVLDATIQYSGLSTLNK